MFRRYTHEREFRPPRKPPWDHEWRDRRLNDDRTQVEFYQDMAAGGTKEAENKLNRAIGEAALEMMGDCGIQKDPEMPHNEWPSGLQFDEKSGKWRYLLG